MVDSIQKLIQTVSRSNPGTKSKLSELSGETALGHWINSASNALEPLLQAAQGEWDSVEEGQMFINVTNKFT